MTARRQRMLEGLQLRGVSARTQVRDVRAVRRLAEHAHQSPDVSTAEALRQEFRDLTPVKPSARSASMMARYGLTCGCASTLHRDWTPRSCVRAPRANKRPVLLSLEAVRTLLGRGRLGAFPPRRPGPRHPPVGTLPRDVPRVPTTDRPVPARRGPRLAYGRGRALRARRPWRGRLPRPGPVQRARGPPPHPCPHAGRGPRHVAGQGRGHGSGHHLDGACRGGPAPVAAARAAGPLPHRPLGRRPEPWEPAGAHPGQPLPRCHHRRHRHPGSPARCHRRAPGT